MGDCSLGEPYESYRVQSINWEAGPRVKQGLNALYIGTVGGEVALRCLPDSPH